MVQQALQVQALGRSQPPPQGPALTLLSMYASASSSTMGPQSGCSASTRPLTDPLHDPLQELHQVSCLVSVVN